MPRGENEEKIARESFINKKISFSDYLSTITAFHKVKADYFETVDLYNQVAIKLEFYIN